MGWIRMSDRREKLALTISLKHADLRQILCRHLTVR